MTARRRYSEDVSALFRRYPQHPTAHPQYPWWVGRLVPVRDVALGLGCWVRLWDDKVVEGDAFGALPWPTEALTAQIEEIDRAEPVRHPPICAGQVWRIDGADRLVLQVDDNGQVTVSWGMRLAVKQPADFDRYMLLYGPHGPWMWTGG